MMSSDPLPSLDILPGPANDTEYEAVYAEIMASERGRSFLTEYAGRNRQSDTQTLVGTIARLEAAMRENAPPHVPAALVRGLVDLAAAIEQVEAVLAATGSSAPDGLLAAERIQNIAAALRRREVETALCDALQAGTREVSDAIMRNKAEATRVLSAVSLLRDLARRVNELFALALAEPVAERNDQPAGSETQGGRDAERWDDTEQDSATDAVDTHSSVEKSTDLLLQSRPMHPLLPDMRAPAGAKEDSGDLFGSPRPPIPSPPSTTEREEAARTKDEAASRILLIETSAADFSAASSVGAKIEKKSPAVPPLPHQGIDEKPAARAVARGAANDPLAAVLALSEEELIALFS